jgi:membrane protease YdiL (CAAX protease family)
MFRLFILSVTAWAVSKLWRGGRDRGAGPGALVLANVVAALAFAAVHLPALFQAGQVSTALVASVIGLNALAGYVMGVVYVRHGLLFAVLAHLGGDVALHLGGRLLV